MEVKVCRGCKKMFQYVSGDQICPKCKTVEETKFQQVKEFLRENPGANMREVNEATEVSVSLIEKFLRQGRLEVAANSPIALLCERCGKRIGSGRYCDSCKHEMTKELQEAKKSLLRDLAAGNSNSQAKMRFMNVQK